MEKKLTIEGMACSHCSGRVEKALQAIPGVTARVELAEKCAYVQGETRDDAALKQAVENAGYQVVDIQ